LMVWWGAATGNRAKGKERQAGQVKKKGGKKKIVV